MNILVTFAVPSEFAPWRGRHTFVSARAGDLILYQTPIGEAEVAVLLTGVGAQRAGASAMGAFLARTDAGREFDFCVSTGLAGSLRPEHRVGNILAAKVVRAFHPSEGRAELASHPELLRIAQDCGAKVVSTFYTAKEIVQTAAEKAHLRSLADAVEMESLEILLGASAWGARAVAIRSIGDEFDEDMPLDFNQAITEKGEVSISNLLVQAAKRPGKLPALMRFGGRSRRAANALADFLDRYIPALAAADVGGKPRREPLAV